MKIINPSIEIMRSGLETNPCTPEQFIEKVGRTCYKSEDKITETSAEKFVSGLIKRGHEAMIEHWNLIFKTSRLWYEEILDDWNMLLSDGYIFENNRGLIEKNLRPYLRFTETMEDDGEMRYIVSGNMRAWRDFAKACITEIGFIPQYMYGMIRNRPTFFPEYQEWIPRIIINNIMIPIDASDLKGEFEHRIHHDITVKFICDRGVSHEIVRHRTASFAQESTRYCNYGLGKFGSEITVVTPSWCGENTNEYGWWTIGCQHAETYYFRLLNAGATPQEARSVLPNSLKTEVIMTGNLDCWDHFFDLRCAPDAHPDIQVVAKMVRAEFEKLFPGRYVNEET